MFTGAVRGWDDYYAVGVSAMRIISACLLASPTYRVRRILDFGCGYGRVARHLRAFFPEADLFLCDPQGAEFCAARFGGEVVEPKDDFSSLCLPKDLDLIWVGSVFTHTDWEQTVMLFDALVPSLRQLGALIITTHGDFVYSQKQAEASPLIAQYEAGGFAYEPYPNFDRWGFSLCSLERLVDIGRRHRDLRLVTYSEVGWAALQDVAAWARIEPEPAGDG